MENFDVAIIGAGPAGCSAALELSGNGLKVALIDKAVFPRDKTCGDAIPGPAIKRLRQLIPDLESKLDALKGSPRITVSIMMGKKGGELSFHWKTLSYNIPRTEFDNFLVEEVKNCDDISIMEGVKVSAMKSDAAHHILDTTDGQFNAKIILDAEGAHSLAYRTFWDSDVKTRPGVALRAYYKGVSLDEHANLVLQLRKSYPGYFWIFPVGMDRFNVGFGMMDQVHKGEKIELKGMLEDLIEHDPRIKPYFTKATLESDIKGYPLPFWNNRLQLVKNNVLLLGDAAALMDPLMGHGIDTAVISGSEAARCVLKSLKENSEEHLLAYDSIIKDGIGKTLDGNYKLLSLIKEKSWLIDLAMWFGQIPLIKKQLQRFT